MPYARMDDRYDDHRKIKRAWRRQPAAVGLHTMAITYANRHQTDGRIDADWIEEKLALLPVSTKQQALILETLVDLRLLELVDDETYRVHDFLDWNLSREQRRTLADQGRKGGHAKATRSSQPDGDGSGPGHSDGSSKGQNGGHSEGSGSGSSTPIHSTPTPTPKTTSETERHPDAARLSRRLADRILRNDPNADIHPESDRWVRDMRLLLADRKGDVAEVERIIDWCQADSFWRSNILCPAKLRKQFTQLLLKAAPTNVSRLHTSRVVPPAVEARLAQLHEQYEQGKAAGS